MVNRSHHAPTVYSRGRSWACLAALALAIAAGCNTSQEPAGGPASPRAQDGRAILDRVAAAYRGAASYRDAGEFLVCAASDRAATDQPHAFSLSLVRPNKIVQELDDSVIVCDGRTYRARIAEFTDRVVERPAPTELSFDNVYSEAFVGEALQRELLDSVPLFFLLHPDPVAQLLDGAGEPLLLPADRIDERPCFRVEIRREKVTLVLWVDQQTATIRQVEKTVRDLEELDPTTGQKRTIPELRIVAEFKRAELGPAIPDALFAFNVPEEARRVERFQTLSKPLAPSALLGQPAPEFALTLVDGTRVGRETLKNKVAVLVFWAASEGPWYDTLRQLEQVWAKYKSQSRVTFLAVNIDARLGNEPTARQVSIQGKRDAGPVSDADVQAAFAKAGLTMPVARDLDDPGALERLGADAIPCVFIVGPDGLVQDHEAGLNPALADELPQRLEKLLAGQSIYPECWTRFENRMRDYAAQLPVTPRHEPERLRVASRWTWEGFSRPGNLLVVDRDGDDSRVYALDGGRKIHELGPEGRIVRTYELDLSGASPPASVSYLRTATATDGQRFFAGATVGSAQMFLFDAEWKRLLVFPEFAADAIADVALADLDGDGAPEINVAYFPAADRVNSLGVMNVSLDGRRRWQNRDLAAVSCLAAADADTAGHRWLLATHSGLLALADYTGKVGQLQPVDNLAVGPILGADLNADGQREFCLLGQRADGAVLAVGLNREGRMTWPQPVPLPGGPRHDPALEPIASGNLLELRAAQWIVAATDGTLLFLEADGNLIDRFSYGEAISGVAVARLGGRPVLLVATSKGVQAWEVGRK